METIIKETHIIYMTYDTTTGEYYIGLRSWRGDKERREYFGSYKKDSDWRPNKKNLVRITLAEYPDRETLKDEEVEWIRPHLGKPLCKNQHNRRLSFDTWGKLGEQSHSYGKTQTKEVREKKSLALKGRPSPVKGRKYSDEVNKKKGLPGELNPMWGKTGAMKGKKHIAETKSKISKSLKGRPGIKGMLGKKHTAESIQLMRQKQLGKKVSEEILAKRRKPQEVVQCPHCGLPGGKSNMTRYHFDNCKKNPNRL